MFKFVGFLFIFLSLLKIKPAVSQHDESQMICTEKTNSLICELHDIKVVIDRLESTLGERIEKFNTKIDLLEEKKKLIEKMDDAILSLETTLINIKRESGSAVEKVNALEEEVRLLWAASRKNNFELHSLESKIQDVGVKQELVTSEVRMIESIVTEQWVQIRQLEQGLQVTEMRTLRARRKLGSSRCTFLKLIKNLYGSYHSKLTWALSKESPLSSYTSQALYQFKKITSAVKRYHHEMQGFVKREMERNEFTASIANQEVVFFVASVLVTFPFFSIWMFLLS